MIVQAVRPWQSIDAMAVFRRRILPLHATDEEVKRCMNCPLSPECCERCAERAKTNKQEDNYESI